VILATDGDFNVGTTSEGDLTRLIKQKAETGVFLSVLGFGMGNFKDATLETLADKGNGNYAYIDTLNEARKVLVDEIGSTLQTIAKDVKIQVELNPEKVGSYRLIGYENRMLKARDFNDDKKDAGEIGAGHTVTALYELTPVEKASMPGEVDPLKYQLMTITEEAVESGELFTLKLRYKKPDQKESRLLTFTVEDVPATIDDASEDFKLAASAAGFGMLLRDSPHKGSATFDTVLRLANQGKGRDPHGYRAELIDLIKKARRVIQEANARAGQCPAFQDELHSKTHIGRC
jgi:Ca-activated chloride channel family protein